MQKSLDKIEKPFPFRHQSNIALDTFQTMILKNVKKRLISPITGYLSFTVWETTGLELEWSSR